MRYAIAIALLSTSCATLFNPGPDRVQVNSRPTGATVYLDGQPIGVTPTVAQIERGWGRSHGEVRIEAEGYEPVTVIVGRRLNATALFNCLWLGADLFIGIIVDTATGNIRRADTRPVYVELPPLPGHASEDPMAVAVSVSASGEVRIE